MCSVDTKRSENKRRASMWKMIDRLLLRCNPELSKGVADLLAATGGKKKRQRRNAKPKPRNDGMHVKRRKQMV